jgi:hypothetical protein
VVLEESADLRTHGNREQLLLWHDRGMQHGSTPW